MSTTARSAIARVALIIAATAAVACTSDFTAPRAPVKGVKAHAQKDTVPFEGDTTACHSGWTIVSGRVVCGEM